jgi:hypothetical protein
MAKAPLDMDLASTFERSRDEVFQATTQDESDGLKSGSLADERFRINLEDVIQYCFPKGYQHPFSGSRLIAFGMYGPLDADGNIRTGYKGNRKVMDYELEEMCIQIERDDIASIYLHNKRDLGLLSSKEQESIIAQADAHLKSAKGRAMLPRLSKETIRDLFLRLPRDNFGMLSFHEMQAVIVAFRENRIKQYKRVFPELEKAAHIDPNATPPSIYGTGPKKSKRPKPPQYVSSEVAPRTMFLKNQGLSNSDMIASTTKALAQFAYQINEIDASGDTSHLTYNVRLLRDVEPKCKDPYVDKKTGKSHREKWSSSTAFML